MSYYKEKYINEKYKHEWIMREYGSWEDHGEPDDHVKAILERSPKRKVRAMSKKEAQKIAESACYQADIRDSGNKFGVKASNAISKFSDF